MGAIAGIIGKNDPSFVKNTIKLLSKRGKNHKVFISDYYSLIVINNDVENNLYEDEAYLIICDAKVYNHGIKNIAKLILEKWLVNKLDDILGMYSALIYDKSKQEFYLLRDSIGYKLVYYNKNKHFSFASEYKAITKGWEKDEEINKILLDYLINAKQVVKGLTLFNDINLLDTSTELKISSNGSLLEKKSSMNFKVNIKYNDEITAANKIKKEFQRVIFERGKSIQKCGVALSSGIDSIGMVYTLRTLFPKMEIHTFTTGYGKDDPDIVIAKSISKELKTFHHEIITTCEDITSDNLEELVYLLEDPLGRTETLQFLMLAKVAQKHVSHLFLGVGADLCFGGMERYKIVYLSKKYPILKNYLNEIYDYFYVGKEPEKTLSKLILDLYSKSPYIKELHSSSIKLDSSFNNDKINDSEYLNKFLLSGFNPGVEHLLQRFEKTLSNHGIDAEIPYLDQKFVKLAFEISDKLKIKNGKQKYILRKSFKGIVNDKYIFNPKRPQKMNHNKMMFDYLLLKVDEEIINNKDSLLSAFLPREYIIEFSKTHYSKTQLDMAAMKLWTILLLEYWLRIFSKNKITQKMKEVMPY